MRVPYLLILTLFPLAGAVLVSLLPRGKDQLAKVTTLVVTLIELAITIAMSAQFRANGPRFQFTLHYPWIPQFGTSFDFGVDGIALVLLALIAVLVPVVVLSSWREVEPAGRSVKTYFALLLALEACMVGVFVATDVFFFYVVFEVMLVPMYFLIASFGGVRRQYAAVKFFLYSLAGGLLMLAAVIALFVISKNNGGNGSFAFADLLRLNINPVSQRWLFLGFFIAFAIKAPLFPFHTWLPDAGAEAPIGTAVLLVGVLDKVGTFGLIRYCLPLFPDASKFFAPMVLILAVIGILYGALLAVGQNDFKRLISYTSIAHFGFIALGIFAFTTQGGSGAVLYMVNHGLSTGALFLIVGFLIARRRSQLMSDFGGAAKYAPLIAGVFLIAGLSSLSLPGTNSFVSEFLVLVGTFSTHRVYAVVGTVGIILAALYILWMFQRMMWGRLNPSLPRMHDLTTREAWVIAPVLVLIVFLGVYPQPLLHVINPAVKATMHDIGRTDPAPTVAAANPGGGK